MKTNKILALILALAMIMSTMGIVASADVAEADVWDGTVDTTWYNDVDTEFTLATAAQLAGLAQLVNENTDFCEKNGTYGDNSAYSKKTIKLSTNIDLAGLAWTPIGADGARFLSNFDGDGYVISNLSVNVDYDGAGLFGTVGKSWGDGNASTITIKNFIVDGATVNGTTRVAAVAGNAYVGAKFENVTLTGNINIYGSSSWVGGIVGYGYTSISNCAVNADAGSVIDSDGEYAGGICGWTGEGASAIAGCSASNVAITSLKGSGGIAGLAHSGCIIDDCDVSNVVVDSADPDYVGLISGRNDIDAGYGLPATIESEATNVTTQSNGTTVTPNDGENVTVWAVKIVDTNDNATYYETLKEALKAYYNDANASTIEILADITYDSNVEGNPWDARTYSGDRYCYATFTKPTVVEGNNHTLTFIGGIEDKNRDAIFRPEADTTFRNLTVDASQLKGLSSKDGGFSAISSGKCNLTVENCTFIGTTQYPQTRGIIFAEGAGKDLSGIEIKVTGSSFINWANGVRDNFNGQDVSKVTVSESDFENASVVVSASETVTFTDNDVDTGYVDIRSYSETNNLNVVATDNEFINTEATGKENYIDASVIETDEEEFTTTAVAEAGGKQYGDLKKAVDAAEKGAIITLLDNIEVSESVVIDKDITIDGTDAKYTIKGADGADTDVPSTTPIKVAGANVTLKNVNIVGGAGDEMNSNTVAAFGAYAVIAENANLSIENATLSGGDVNAEYVAVGGAIDAVNSEVKVKDSVLETGKQADGINDAVVFPVIITDNETELEVSNTTIKTNIPENMYTADAVLIAGSNGNGGFYEIENPVDMYDNIKIEGIVPLSNVEVNVPAGEQIKIEGKVAEDMFIPASVITVNLVPVDGDDTENNEFYINLTAGENTKIFEFESAQLTFKNESKTESTNARMPYTVYGENGVEVIRNTGINDGVNAEKQTFGLYLNDAATLTDGHNTGAEITIGKIVFDGKGAMKMSVVAEESEVVATKVGTTDEAHYTANGEKDASYSLVARSEIGSTSQHEKRNVKIKVEFEHDMDNVGADNDSVAYRNLKVTLKDATGASVTKDIEMKNVLEGEVTFENVLVGVITVTLKASGFRTYTYQTTMEEGSSANGELVLNFWNSVLRDKKAFIEAGNKRSEMAHNFLVGDIAMDYIIDKYDLAAVTSYYGNYDIKTGDKYVRYDLNRDHQIDILDVAYVLHGMGN